MPEKLTKSKCRKKVFIYLVDYGLEDAAQDVSAVEASLGRLLLPGH